MFPARYFPSRYFPARYFGKVGAEPVATFGVLTPVLGVGVAGAIRLHASRAGAETIQASSTRAERLHASPTGGGS